MATPIAMIKKPVAQQRRLRTVVKRLVIELGYLEHCLTEDVQDLHLHTAATGLDTAIARLNAYLESC